MINNQLKVNDLILLTIKRMGINGEGIGYYKRLAIFVKEALPEEIVEVKITKIEERYAYGEITKFKEKSPDRIDPQCPYFGHCGGCTLQHLKYEGQLKAKRNIVCEAFERYVSQDVSRIEIRDTIGMEEPWNYRNKCALPTRHDGEKVVVGLYEEGSNRLVYIDKCLIDSNIVRETAESVLEYLTKSNIDIYNPRFHQGNLRYLVVRGFEETNEVQVTFVIMKEEPRLLKILSKCIEIKNVKSVNYTINNDPKNIDIIVGQVNNLAGDKTIEGKVFDLNFDIYPNSFFQLNTKQMKVLYTEVKKAAKLKGDEKVLDLYCGIGAIGLTLAREVKEVRGIDVSKASIQNAKVFAEKNDITNATFYDGRILPILDKFLEEGWIPDIVVMDPARKGAELLLLNKLQELRIKRIVYVSCNPSTLTKNLDHLKRNYVIRYVQPIDMFPQTANVECVVYLERRYSI